MSERDRLLSDVFTCRHCEEYGVEFARRDQNTPFYRFPPVIGALGDVAVLFIGINPRITASNKSLHDSVSSDMAKFEAIANNTFNDSPYIVKIGSEKYYNPHAVMMDKLFPGKPFEDVAAETELYYCASKDASDLNLRRCFCAEQYMGRVFALTRPKVVVAIGDMVEKYLRTYSWPSADAFKIRMGGHAAKVIPVFHPNNRHITNHERNEKWKWATAAVKSILNHENVPSMIVTNPTGNPVITNVVIIRTCEWDTTYGWKPFQRSADLDQISADPSHRIEYHLTQRGNTKFILSMSAAEWKTVLGNYYSRPDSLWRQNGYVVSLNRIIHGMRTENFVERWKPYIRKA